jgi:hypothetical protein
MVYCGHKDVVDKTLSGGRLNSTTCEAKTFVNCPACRVFNTDMTAKIKSEGKWIGYSGLIYCGGEGCNVDKGKNCD